MLKTNVSVRLARAFLVGLVFVASTLTVVSCGGDDDESSKGSFGKCCEDDSDCGGGACDTKHGHCSFACSSDSDCPNADEPIGAGSGDGKCDDGLCESDYYQDLCDG